MKLFCYSWGIFWGGVLCFCVGEWVFLPALITLMHTCHRFRGSPRLPSPPAALLGHGAVPTQQLPRPVTHFAAPWLSPPPTPLRLPPSKLPPGRSMDAGGPAWRRGCAESAESLNAAGRLCSSRNEQPPPPQQRARGSGAPRVSRPSPLRSPIVLSSSYGGNVRTLPPSSHGASNLETLSSLWGRESRRMRGGKTKRPPSPESPKQMAISCTLAPL